MKKKRPNQLKNQVTMKNVFLRNKKKKNHFFFSFHLSRRTYQWKKVKILKKKTIELEKNELSRGTPYPPTVKETFFLLLFLSSDSSRVLSVRWLLRFGSFFLLKNKRKPVETMPTGAQLWVGDGYKKKTQRSLRFCGFSVDNGRQKKKQKKVKKKTKKKKPKMPQKGCGFRLAMVDNILGKSNLLLSKFIKWSVVVSSTKCWGGCRILVDF